MKAARLLVLFVAIGAGGAAALLAGRSDPPPPPAKAAAPVDAVDVLVASGELPIGKSLAPSDLKWQSWPTGAALPQYIRKSTRPEAVTQLAGSITRATFLPGEPIREEKLIKADGSGYLAAILQPGMRAISTEITPETGVGGFVLPNDRVDVLLTRAEKSDVGDVFVSERVLTNVRILAIDQQVQEKDGQRTVIGKLATLELSPRQAQTLAIARRFGTLSLVLRSLVDSNARAGDEDPTSRFNSRESINLVRFGRTTMTLK